MSMNLKQAQLKMAAAVTGNPERAIEMAIAFRPETAELVATLRQVKGTLVGVAAGAVRSALVGSTQLESEQNIIKFAEIIEAQS